MTDATTTLLNLSDVPHGIQAIVLGAASLVQGQSDETNSERNAALLAAVRLLEKAAEELVLLADAMFDSRLTVPPAGGDEEANHV